MTIYTASREPILLAGRLTSTGFKRKPPKRKPKKAEPLAMGFGFFVVAMVCEKILGGVDMYNNSY
ncbi:hypothetical protein CGH21_24225 [Vibrio parahaemolyticus]|nr:hypothetical protein CGH67_26370 [Vibrio parahaemolyticus]TOM98318.1 hypothetical protein CGH66_10380 [Vibrio parahaemolyticus]TON07418.1 hypothetical protein CGH64_24415 [Vibrio parahaemolyticus]TON28732.1 hypothetical protein CGH59_24535 [Vibrio parahaemolyticus]TON45378.1 hypothetical protein CGH56_24295 [Vibrio parahaemolyticus]